MVAMAVNSPAVAPAPGVIPSLGMKKDIQNVYCLDAGL